MFMDFFFIAGNRESRTFSMSPGYFSKNLCNWDVLGRSGPRILLGKPWQAYLVRHLVSFLLSIVMDKGLIKLSNLGALDHFKVH